MLREAVQVHCSVVGTSEFYNAVTVLSILTCSARLIVAKIADRLSIVGFPDTESIRWRLLLGL
jgi:hypothetical protein